ncbi:hypothetical protein DSO57_1027663 [Entomophthora muscae]|uniref:Uncharacterized protein n=1 Tax=Entomophthora muscae TaxID=34485 RepID=A0ACC2UC26_9FUNG|nr:hypothetical protein DSO57_1027663 [Entomophthora muscae]
MESPQPPLEDALQKMPHPPTPGPLGISATYTQKVAGQLLVYHQLFSSGLGQGGLDASWILATHPVQPSRIAVGSLLGSAAWITAPAENPASPFSRDGWSGSMPLSVILLTGWDGIPYSSLGAGYGLLTPIPGLTSSQIQWPLPSGCGGVNYCNWICCWLLTAFIMVRRDVQQREIAGQCRVG